MPSVSPSGGEQHDRVGAGEAAAQIFAQRPGRDHPAVAKAIIGVDDEQRQSLGDRRVLKPVVEQDRLGAGFDRGGDTGGAVARDPARRARGEQQRLVADLAASCVGDRPAPARQSAAIAARHDVHGNAARGEPVGERQRHRRLAGAAGDQIADADHRRRRAVGPRQCPAQPSGGIPRGAERRQQIGGEPRLLAPENWGGAHHARNERGARGSAVDQRAVGIAIASHRREPVEPWREAGEDGVENALTAGGRAGAGGAARGAQPAIASSADTACASSSTPLTVCAAPAAASAAAMRRAIAHVRPVQHGAVEPRRLERVVAALRRQRAADKGDPGKAVEQAELAHRIGEIDLGVGGDRLAAAAPGDAQARWRQASRRSRRRAPGGAAR